MELLIESGTNLESQGKKGETALYHAIVDDAIELLHRNGANFKRKNKHGETPQQQSVRERDG